jgi:outer membrane biosynthesis protein TonB
MFLGAMVVVLLLALIFLSIRLLSNGAADRSAGEPAPTAAPGPVDPSPDRPIDGDLPELDALDVTPAPAREPTPATVRTTPRATPAVARPTPAPRSTPEPTPSTTPAPTPEPTAEPTPEPSPEPTKVRGDLRDPWAD